MSNQTQNITSSPDYKRIYIDIITRKYPEKMQLCKTILSKKKLSFLDIIRLNNLLFEKDCRKRTLFNQQHRSYDPLAISQILEYQVNNQLNNSQLAAHFKLSRNTVAKWRKQKDLV